MMARARNCKLACALAAWALGLVVGCSNDVRVKVTVAVADAGTRLSAPGVVTLRTGTSTHAPSTAAPTLDAGAATAP